MAEAAPPEVHIGVRLASCSAAEQGLVRGIAVEMAALVRRYLQRRAGDCVDRQNEGRSGDEDHALALVLQPFDLFVGERELSLVSLMCLPQSRLIAFRGSAWRKCHLPR